MSKSRLKYKILGPKHLKDILFEVLGNKLLNGISKDYIHKSIVMKRFNENDIEIVSFKKGVWKVRHNDFVYYLRDNKSDIYVFRQVILENEYDSFFEMCKKFSTQIDTMIDLGSNIGLTSMTASKYFSNISITAVEPSAETYKILQQNLSENNINHTTINKGVWNQKTKLRISEEFRDGKAWSLMVKPDPNGDIEAIDLLDLYTNHTIDILKMDIEGTEQILFQDKEYASRFLSKTKFIAIEIHEEFIEKNKVHEILAENGFEIFESGELSIGRNTNLVN